VRLGEPPSPDDFAAARQRIATALADNGYYDSHITSQPIRDPTSELANVVFSIDPGRPARLSGAEFVGQTVVPPARLASVSGWRTGTQLTSARIEQGLSRLQRFYIRQGRQIANVRVRKRDYDSARRTEKLIVQVEAGPEVVVRVRGASLSVAKLRTILPVYREGTVDEVALLEGERALEEYFERQGFYAVKIKLEPHNTGAERLEITYTVTLGSRGAFVGYTFRGDRVIPASELRSVLTIQPEDLPQLPHGIFNHDLLDQDVRALTALYQSRGFLEAKISAHADSHYENRAGRVFVTFQIEEGPQTTVAHLAIRGVSSELEARVRPGMLNRPGQPYSPERGRKDRDTILSYFNDRGYSRATVDWRTSLPSPQSTVDVEYDVDLGPQQRIQQVAFLGDEHTRRGVINRELTIEEGQPLNQAALLESQQRLYNLGLFNQVQVTALNPNSPEAAKAVVVALEEARRWTVGYGGGLDVQSLPVTGGGSQYRVSPRGTLEVSRLNVWGRPQTFTLRGHISDLEKIGSTSYLIPGVLNQRDLSFRIYALVDQSRNVVTFDSKRQEAGIVLQKQYSSHASLLARYSFRRVEVSNLQISPGAVPLFSQPVRVATLGASWVNDHRDNLLDATRGSLSQADADVAWTKLGSQADFVRFFVQNSTYHPIRSRLTFARSTRLGVESAFGPESVPGGVPLPERFFIGGSESHRGFALNQGGPLDPISGYPVGGKALFLNQLELRMRLEENRYGLVLFHDGGNVYSTVRTLRLLKFSQSSPTDFDYSVQAVGLGFRYQTPVGPLRFDVAYSPNVPRFLICANQQVTVCPPQEVEVRRLPFFQFFLSIGQSF